MDLMQREIHKNANAHGWWEEERNFGELIALCHSELSEALEEYRKGKKPNETYFYCDRDKKVAEKGGHGCIRSCEHCEFAKPEGIPTELADVVIRIMDMSEWYGIDLDAAIRRKHEYNKTRPYKHGGKVI